MQIYLVRNVFIIIKLIIFGQYQIHFIVFNHENNFYLYFYFTVNVSFHIPAGVADDKFTISSDGIVRLRGPLDREKISRYSVPILAKSTKLLDLTTLDIVIQDENDNAPEFRSGSCYTLAVPENQEASIIHTISAVDNDEGKNGEIIYSIIGKNLSLEKK